MTPWVVPFNLLIPDIIFLPCLRQRTTHLFGNHAWEFRRRQITQGTVGSEVIEMSSPLLDCLLFVEEVSKPMFVQTFIAQLPVISDHLRGQSGFPALRFRKAGFLLCALSAESAWVQVGWFVCFVNFPAKKNTKTSIAEATIFWELALSIDCVHPAFSLVCFL